MKKILLATMIASTLALTACNCNQNAADTKGGNEEVAGTTGTAATGVAALTVGKFAWDGINKSSADLGSFPYFNVPEGFKLQSADGDNKFTKMIDGAKDGVNFFDGKAISTVKGKLAFLDIESDGDTFDQEAFDANVTEQMKEIGATEITSEVHSDEVLAQLAEIDGVHVKDYLDCEHDDVKLRQFVLNNENGHVLYQVASDEHHGQVAVLEADDSKASEEAHAHSDEHEEEAHDEHHEHEHEHDEEKHAHEHEHNDEHGDDETAHDEDTEEHAEEEHAHEHDEEAHDDEHAEDEHEEAPAVEEAPVVESSSAVEEMKSQLNNNGKATVRINFDSSKATIRDTNMGDVDTIYTLLTDNAELKLSIEGHTDSSGNDESNKELSTARATAVMDALVKKGIAADRLKAIGFGEEKPVVSNDTAESRALNRRVELVKF